MPKKRRPAEENLSTEQYYQRAHEFFNRGSQRKAITELNRAIRLNPQYAEAYNLRGMARAFLGDFHMAIDDFNLAIHHNPGQAAAFVNRANLNLQLGNLQAAVDDYTVTIRLGIPLLEVAYFHRGAAQFEQGKNDAALKDFNQAIALKPDFAEVYHARGDLRRLLFDLDGALGDYTQAIRLAPQASIAYIRRAEVLRLQRQYDAAIADYTVVIGLEPKVPDPYLERGQLYDRNGEVARAIADYERYVDLGGSPTNTRILNVSRRIFHLRLKVGLTPGQFKSRRWFTP